MKKVLLSFCFLLISYISFAQLNCLRPITTNDYNQKKRVVAAIYNEAEKLQKGIQFVQTNCLSVVQVKDFASMFRNDEDRLQFTQEAYNSTFDKDNFYEVYDAFTKFSDVFRLHDYVLARRSGITIPINPNNPTNPPIVVPPTTQIEINYPPNIYFPSIAGYNGKKNCSNVVSEANFDAYMQQIVFSDTEFSRAGYIKKLTSRRAGGNCFSIAQAMKMTLQLPTETTRLDVLKSLYPYLYDLDNISQAVQVFSTRENQDDWLAFIQNPTANPNNPTNPNGNPTTVSCVVTSQEFDALTTVLNNEYSSASRMIVAKNTCRNFKCFSIAQVRVIIKMFNTESLKLDIAKYLYDYTDVVQRKQYFSISTEFYTSNARTDFSNFLAAKK